MTITKQTVADKIAAYLHHEISLAQLVDWSERALMDGELSDAMPGAFPVIARLGVADVRAFGLAWDDCEELLHKLGFSRASKWWRRNLQRLICPSFHGQSFSHCRFI